MFRKPRDDPSSGFVSIPSVGRPPTPPLLRGQFATQTPSSTNTVTTTSMAVSRLKSSPSAGSATGKLKHVPSSKPKAKGNASILSFFKKAEPSPQLTIDAKEETADAENSDDDGLFVTDDTPTRKQNLPDQVITSVSTTTKTLSDLDHRYNENTTPSKRRRLSMEDGCGTDKCLIVDGSRAGDLVAKPEALRELDASSCSNLTTLALGQSNGNASTDVVMSMASSPLKRPLVSLKREQTSVSEDLFDGIEDFADDEFPEGGEEFEERIWLQEQRAMEREYEQDADLAMTDNEVAAGEELSSAIADGDAGAGAGADCACPICNASLTGLSADQASLHVNRCLDGDPLPVSRPNSKAVALVKSEVDSQASPKRFQRATIPRPPQENPFQLGSASLGGSAFSKIMSSHAEDEAWSVAAANEMAARGKPAFKRTCPFYKILPGLSICVDAFRYGAVEGCNAYFLSHFHSDHYIGLTSTWCHGPIYCSRVTGNLVRQQLRVDPRWVVDLEFEEKREVPGTNGVQVTMIPANHCPGSSLYLFEKAIGKGSNPRLQRILHCGDFRACPAHVQHPLLRPDVIDAVTGKKRQQRLDVCYLDTTYLTPKYAFPSQEEVIRACADMCVSLSKERVDESDSWEQTKKQRAGSGMVKFVKTETIKQEEKKEGDEASEMEGIVSAVKKESGKARGRLLVVVGTYSIGKERICLGVAKALGSKIFAAPAKQRICRALEDPELSGLLTSDPLEAQVHMQMLMEIRAETLADYLTGYKPHFSRIVGFRPSGWNYRPPQGRFLESPSVQTVLHSDNWKTRYTMAELVPQRGSTREASCFGVPYSEHSSFRELSMFCCALRIDRIIPTVNVGSAKSRERMKVWTEKWAMEKKKNGLFRVEDGARAWS